MDDIHYETDCAGETKRWNGFYSALWYAKTKTNPVDIWKIVNEEPRLYAEIHGINVKIIVD